MQQDETFVQLDAACVDRFLAAIGPQAVLERSIRVVQLDGAPEFAARGSGPKPFAGKRRPAGKPHRKGGEWRDDAKPWAKKDGKPGKPKFAKPAGGKKKARKKPD